MRYKLYRYIISIFYNGISMIFLRSIKHIYLELMSSLLCKMGHIMYFVQLPLMSTLALNIVQSQYSLYKHSPSNLVSCLSMCFSFLFLYELGETKLCGIWTWISPPILRSKSAVLPLSTLLKALWLKAVGLSFTFLPRTEICCNML